MCFPFEFSKRSGDYDFISPIVNFTGNAAVLAVAGISLGIISNLAFKALGFNTVATSIATAIPVTLGIAGIGAAIIGAACIAAIFYAFINAYINRR